MTHSYCFFDLDGTIINSAPGIFRSIRYALEKMNRPVPQNLNKFLGPPLHWGFTKAAGLSDTDAQRAIDLYREYYREGAMFDCTVYTGVPELLKSLNNLGVTCVLATCKPHEFAKQILEKLGLLQYFDFVSGPEIDGTRGEKHEVIAYAVEKLQITDKSRILMVGDRSNDIGGAITNKIQSVGVLWGFGSREELLENGADFLIESPQDLLPLL